MRPIASRAGPALLVASLIAALWPLVAASPIDEKVLAAPRVIERGDPPAVHLAPMFGGELFQRPLDARQAPGDDGTWYVVEQHGVIWRLTPRADGWSRHSFLDIAERVRRDGNEEGLLGLAFSPHFGEDGHPHARALYVNYTVKSGERRSRLSRFFAGPGRVPADPASEQVLLEVPQPFSNHNGGGLVFGPDGCLYYSLGDGGSAGDPHKNGQDPATLLATILRLDVDPLPGDVASDAESAPSRADPDAAAGAAAPPADVTAAPPAARAYRIPPDNPFVGRDDAAPEVYAYGLRNAWRFSFDRETGELWAADVGQDRYEWVTVVTPGGNHGWSLVEGFHRFDLPRGTAPPPGLVAPVFEYPHARGLSITGGFVYRGSAIPELVGWYVYGDYVNRRIWALRRRDDGVVEHVALLRDAAFVSSFAEGHDGELLVVDHMGSRRVWRLQPGAAED